MTYQQCIHRYLQTLVARNDVPDYISQVKARLRRFEKECPVSTPGKLKPKHINDWLASLHRNLGGSTVANYRATVVAWLTWLSGEEYIGECNWQRRVEKVKTEGKRPNALTREQTRRFITATQNMIYRNTFTERRNLALICFFLDTGLREAECLNLRLDDVDINTCRVRIRASIAKCRKERVVWFSSATLRVLKAYMRVRRNKKSKYLWLTRLGDKPSKSLILQIVKRIGATCGVPEITVHALRHSAATSMIRNGISLAAASALLGHSSLRTTEIYLHLVEDDIREQYANAAPLSWM
jgi:integrase/recombinase XerD